MSDDRTIGANGFDKLVDWATDIDDDTLDSQLKSRVVDTGATRMQAYTVIAATGNMKRMQKLHAMLERVDDNILERIEELTPSQLMALRGYLEKDLGATIDKMLPKSESGVSHQQTIQILNQGQGTGATGSTSHELSQESREKVRTFVKGLVTNGGDSPPALRVVNGTAEKK